MRNIPYIVAVDCPVPPPNKLVYHTLQLARHDIIDMRSQPSFARYEWTPYIPEHVRQEGNYEKTPVQVPLFLFAFLFLLFSRIVPLHRCLCWRGPDAARSKKESCCERLVCCADAPLCSGTATLERRICIASNICIRTFCCRRLWRRWRRR